MEAPGSRAPGSSAGTFTSPTIGTGMRSNGWDPEAGNIEGCEGCEPKRPVMVEGSMFWMLSSLSMEGRWVLRADSPNTKANPSCSTLCTRDSIFADRKDSLRSSLLWLFWLGMLWMVTDFFLRCKGLEFLHQGMWVAQCKRKLLVLFDMKLLQALKLFQYWFSIHGCQLPDPCAGLLN